MFLTWDFYFTNETILVPFCHSYRTAIIEAFEKAKEKHNPELHRRTPIPTITLDQLQQEYIARVESRMNGKKSSPSPNLERNN